MEFNDDDDDTFSTVEICGGQKKDAEVFRSTSNIVEIVITQSHDDDPPHFLLKYQGKKWYRLT